MAKFQKYSYWLLPFLYLLVALFATNRNYFLPSSKIADIHCLVSQYNNFIIFKNSFFHLISGADLYQSFPHEQYDLFKYTPTFSLIFGIIAVLPNYLGLLLWNLLNVMLPLFAIHQIFGLNQRLKTIFTLLLLPEFFTTILNSQSNGLILGLLLFAFSAIQKNETRKAVVFILLTAFIKLFGVFFFAIFLIYPNQLKKAAINGIIFSFLLLLMPLLIVDLSYLIKLYHSYFNLLKNDGSQFVKYSFAGWLNQWFSFYPSKNIVVLFGFIVQLLPVLLVKNWTDKSRIIYAATFLIWMVVFNHMAESATYIIAVGAIFLAFSTFEKLSIVHLLLLLFMFLSAELGPSDIYPKELRVWIVETAQLKAFSCILIWLYLISDIIKVAVFFKDDSFD